MSISEKNQTSMSSEDLVKRAVDLGIGSVESLQRMTHSTIHSMIRLYEKRREKRVAPGDSLSHKPLTKEQLERNDQGRDHGRGRETDQDDTRTVVDMSFMLSAKTPTEVKYNRFRELLRARASIRQTLENNQKELACFQEVLDQEDQQMLNEALLKTCEEKLKLIHVELQEIHQWFTSVSHEKVQSYHELRDRIQQGKLVDMTGTILNHLEGKCSQLERQLLEIQSLISSNPSV